MPSRLRRVLGRTFSSGSSPSGNELPGDRLARRRLPIPRFEPGPTLALAVACYLPLLLTHRGKVGADTKAYLYLDPGRLLSRAAYLWDPAVGMGTVTHQNIGYLFPMGPYYWLADAIGLPDWVAQRIWLGSIMFIAGLGVAYLLRTLAWQGSGRWVAVFAYALSPYLLHYVYKHSVILLPYAALGWLVAFTARSLRERNGPGAWRAPAMFAMTCLWSGGINATSLLLVLVAPALWVAHVVVVEKELRLRSTFRPLMRMGVLTGITSLWWIAGLMMQGRYGIDVLKYTETYRTVAQASTGAEVFRGLGYWFFYGTDILGPWFKAAVTYTQSLPALALSFALPILAVTAALWTRFRYRIFFVVTGLAGFVLSVGAHPFNSPSPYGQVFSAFTDTKAGLAMRSTPRAIPLLALAMAVFLGAGVRAISVRPAISPRIPLATSTAAFLLIVANLSPLWMGRMLDEYLERPEDVPSYWVDAARSLNAEDAATRALAVPGIDFANYRWGSTVDPIMPGLTDHDYAARELVPYGSEPSADFMNAIDAPLVTSSLDPDGYARMLRLGNFGNLIERHDLEYERYLAPRPRIVAAQIDAASGLERPTSFGTPRANVPDERAPLIDDLELSQPDDQPDPAPVRIRRVADALPEVRLAPDAGPVIVSGSAAGLVNMADNSLLDPERLIVYSGSVSDDSQRLDQLLESGASLVVTDTNRKAARRWGTLRDNDGATERAGDRPTVDDPTDNRLELFTDSDGNPRDDSTRTVATPTGGVWAVASAYGNNLTFTPSDRPYNAVDGDPTTAWKVAAGADPRGEWIDVRLDEPVTTDHIRLVQADRFVNRHIEGIDLSLDGHDAIALDLDASSWSGDGQTVRFPAATFTSARLTIRTTDRGPLDSYRGVSGVGFSSIDIDGRQALEVLRPPTDLVTAAGSALRDHRLTYVLTRLRTDPHDRVLRGPELAMSRRIELPDRRGFAVSGRARISAEVDDATVDAILGRPTASAGGVTVSTSSHLAGDIRWRGPDAVDGDPATAWQSAFSPQPGTTSLTLTRTSPATTTLRSITVMADGRHSVPRQIHIEVDGATPSGTQNAATLVGTVTDSGRGGRATLTLDPPVTVTGTSLRVVVDRIDEATTNDWLTGRAQVLPVGIAELGGDDVPRALPVPASLPRTCRADLLTVGDTPIPLALVGTTAAARAGQAVALRPCTDSATPVDFSAGATLVRAADGRNTGVDVDGILLDSPADATRSNPSVASTPGMTVDRTGRLGYDLGIDELDRPTWLVLGQSYNAGWHLSADGKDLGPSELVNGFANGWRLDPTAVGTSPHLRLTWTPQRVVWFGLGLSLLGALVCLAMILSKPGPPDPLRGEPMAPASIAFRDCFGEPPDMRTSVVATAVSALFGAVFVGPVVGTICLGAAMWAALRTRWGWPLLRIATLASLGLSAAYVVAREWRSDLRVDFDWPNHFEVAHTPITAAIALIAVECFVEVVRAGWRRRTGLGLSAAASPQPRSARASTGRSSR